MVQTTDKTHDPMTRFLLCLALLSVFSVMPACERMKLAGVEFDKIDTSEDPEQIRVAAADPIVITTSKGTLTLTPQAKYRLSGRVVSSETYSDGWESAVSPLDLAVVWGKLADPQADHYVSYSQSSRWYFYKTRPGSSLEISYISSHSGNNHIIPANDNVRRAARSIRRKEKVILEGFLVNLRGTLKGKEVFWNTSLSRTDTGNGSCELFYVNRIRVESNVYE